jgi:hypothetical protein
MGGWYTRPLLAEIPAMIGITRERKPGMTNRIPRAPNVTKVKTFSAIANTIMHTWKNRLCMQFRTTKGLPLDTKMKMIGLMIGRIMDASHITIA